MLERGDFCVKTTNNLHFGRFCRVKHAILEENVHDGK